MARFALGDLAGQSKTFTLPGKLSFSTHIAIQGGRRVSVGIPYRLGRRPVCAIATTAAMPHRNGDDLLGFIPRGIFHTTALEIAARLGPFGRILNKAFTPSSMRDLRYTAMRHKPTKPNDAWRYGAW